MWWLYPGWESPKLDILTDSQRRMFKLQCWSSWDIRIMYLVFKPNKHQILFQVSPHIKSSQTSARISFDSMERFCISLTVLMRKSSCWRTSSCFSFCRFSMANRIASDIWSILHYKNKQSHQTVAYFYMQQKVFLVS